LSNTCRDVAAKVAELVERKWAESTRNRTHLEPSDTNEVFLYLAFPRAYRCFQSIRRLCSDPASDGEDPLILARALLSLTLRSTWPVATSDPAERWRRGQRRAWYTLSEEAKRARAITDQGDPDEVEYLERVTHDLAGLEEWFASEGLTPSEMPEADIARELGLGVFYDHVFRMGSAATHHSQLAALASFDDDRVPRERLPAIPLLRSRPELSEDALFWATATYAAFLKESEPTMQLGIEEELDEVLAPLKEYLAAPG
jgi:hypothetical protein